jgi:hypothetical protein
MSKDKGRIKFNKHGNSITMIEIRPSVRKTVLKGIEYGLSFQAIANTVGVLPQSISGWLKRAKEKEQNLIKLGLTKEEIYELSTLDGELLKDRDKYIEKYGEGVIKVVERDKFWLEFVVDMKKADGRSESRMLGVIRRAAIGQHEVSEKKTESITLKQGRGQESVNLPATKTTTITKELSPQWQAAAWFLERKWPEKYAQRKITDGLPPEIPYEVFMTAKLLLQLPRTELDRIKEVLRSKMQPKTIEFKEDIDVPSTEEGNLTDRSTR